MNTRLIGLQLGLIKSAYAGIAPAYPPVLSPSAGITDSGVEIPANKIFGRKGVFDPLALTRVKDMVSLPKELLISRAEAAQSAKDLAAAQQFSEARELASSANRNAIAKEWQKYTKSKYNSMAGGADSRAMGGILGRLGTRDWTTLSQKEKYDLINPATEKALRRM